MANSIAVRLGCLLPALLIFAACGSDSPTDGGPLAVFAISPSSDTLPMIGDSVRLTVSGTNAFGLPVPTGAVTWSTSDQAVVEVGPTGIATARGKGTATITATAEQGATATATLHVDYPVLSVPPFDLLPVLSIIPFGVPLKETLDNPTYEYYTDGDGWTVYAAISGVVTSIDYPRDRETDDYAVRLEYSPGWVLSYDHVSDVMVAVGDTVAPGDSIARIAFYGMSYEGQPDDPIRLGRVEIQFGFDHDDGQGVFEAICPALYGTSEFNASHRAMLDRFDSGPTEMCAKDRVLLP